jgi:arylsulfatase A-like enzyme
MTRRHFLGGLLAGSLAGAQPKRPPNIVFILIDDMGWTDLGCFGTPLYQTPHIDKLAQKGMRFTSAYSACAVCSPTRAAVLTGKYPARLHVTDWIPGRIPPGLRMKPPEWTPYLDLKETTIAEALKPLGYTSASIGKWHLGGEEYYPERQGFDVNVAGCHLGAPPDYFAPYGIPTLTDGPKGEYLTDRLTEEALKFIERSKDRPFFLYLAHYGVHTPLQAKNDVAARYAERIRPGMGHTHPVYAAMVESVDDSVGRIMRRLDEWKLTQDTIVIFTSDNGGVVGRRHITSNEPLREEKSTLYEGGIRVPMIVRWPGVVQPGSVSDVPVSSVDHFPSLVEIAGATPQGVDGVSLTPLLRQQPGFSREAIYWHYPHYNFHQPLIPMRPAGAIRKGDFKLIEFYEDGHAELYNLREDIGERRNLARSNRAKAAELRADLEAWRKSVGAQMPIPVPANYDPAKTEEWMRDWFQRQVER